MPRGVYKKINCSGKKKEFTPLAHQLEVVNFFAHRIGKFGEKGPFKGLLLYHKLGSGKTCTAILTADKMLKKNLVKHVYIFSPGSLRNIWISEYCETCGIDKSVLREKFTFVTYNYNVKPVLETLDFTDSLVIIDEVHNLINGYKNFSKNAVAIYTKIDSSNCRILALSGTPIYNFIYEFDFLGRLLKPGDEFPNMMKKKGKKQIIDELEFTGLLETKLDGEVVPKNATSMKRRLEGIISYYPGMGDAFMPDVQEQEPIRCTMTIDQQVAYAVNREQELKLSQFPPDETLIYRNKKLYDLLHQLYIMAKKCIMSRKSSNFYYPNGIDVDETKTLLKKQISKKVEKEQKEEAEGKENDDSLERLDNQGNVLKRDIPVKSGGWVSKELFADRKLATVFSPKFTALLVNIILHIEDKHVVFSFFKEKAGVYMIHTLLKMCGIKSAVFSGDLQESERRTLLKKMNSKENVRGDLVRVLLVTEAGAEGISVFGVKHMHILESTTRPTKISQAMGRVARYKSHLMLPPDERYVKVWRYWSVCQDKKLKIKIKTYNSDGKEAQTEKIYDNSTLAIDAELYYNEVRIMKGIKSFLKLLEKSSVTTF